MQKLHNIENYITFCLRSMARSGTFRYSGKCGEIGKEERKSVWVFTGVYDWTMFPCGAGYLW